MFNMTYRNRYVYPMEALTRVIDITAAPYNAIGDDNDDDDAIITAAIADASDLVAVNTVYFPQGIWKIQNTMVLRGVHVLASPGAVFRTEDLDLTMVKLQKVSWWQGGAFKLSNVAGWDGIIFSVDGDDELATGFSGENLRAPLVSDVDMFFPGHADGLGVGIYLESTVSATKMVTCAQFNNIRMKSPRIGIHTKTANGGYVNANHFNDILIMGYRTGIYMEKLAGTWTSAGNLFSNITLQTSGTPLSVNAIVCEGSSNLFSNLMCWDIAGNTGDTLVVSGSDNTFQGHGLTKKILDTGTGNLIQGFTNKTWAGANFGEVIETTYVPGTLGVVANGAVETSGDITLPGVELGDFVLLSSVNVNGMLARAIVTAANTVKIQIINRTGGNATATSSSWNLLRIPKIKKTLATTWDPASLADGVLEGLNVTVTGAVVGDMVIVGPGVDTSGCWVQGYVTAPDTVQAAHTKFFGRS